MLTILTKTKKKKKKRTNSVFKIIFTYFLSENYFYIFNLLFVRKKLISNIIYYFITRTSPVTQNILDKFRLRAIV